jgi:hypothetical protein
VSYTIGNNGGFMGSSQKRRLALSAMRTGRASHSVRQFPAVPNVGRPAIVMLVFVILSMYLATFANLEHAIAGSAQTGQVEPDSHTTWPTDILDWESSPVDLSFLNEPEKPAGKRGFLRGVRDKLIFEDGTTARFWGTNITAYALFGEVPQESVRRQARRLSELGFNLVRLHHHDSPWVDPNIFGDAAVTDTKHLSEAMLERIDWWIKCLKDEGIYVWLDLEVGRQLRPGDGIDGFAEISRGEPAAYLKAYNYVNISIQAAMQRFNEAYLNHLNRFTGLRYKDDPAIAAVLITNENEVTHHFGSAFLPKYNVPKHTALYMAQAEAFASKHGLSKRKVWRAWEPGPSKLFLNDLERAFNVKMIEHLRALGVKVPIVTTSSWAGNPLTSLPALTAGDLIDVHSYLGARQLELNPLRSPNIMHWTAAAQVVDRPLSVTEWNLSPFPAPDRHAIPLYMAGSASFQGWDALMQYAYSQRPIVGPGAPSNWHAYNDPALIATLPAAALLYRRQDVQESRAVYVFAPSKAQLFDQVISPETSVALRTAADKGKVMVAMPQTKELPWLERSRIPAGAIVVTDPSRSFIDAEAKEASSDTGELRRNWEQGIYTIDTPRTQAATGRIGGKSISLADVDIAIDTPNATVSVQSLETEKITSAHAILISLGARSVPKSATEMPFYSEPVVGQLAVRARPGLKLYPQSGPQKANAGINVPYEDGQYRIRLDRNLGTYWLLLK